jgi:hypothetical protein
MTWNFVVIKVPCNGKSFPVLNTYYNDPEGHYNTFRTGKRCRRTNNTACCWLWRHLFPPQDRFYCRRCRLQLRCRTVVAMRQLSAGRQVTCPGASRKRIHYVNSLDCGTWKVILSMSTVSGSSVRIASLHSLRSCRSASPHKHLLVNP